ncbi:MAG: sulfite exporter TauE/SafE family protein [Devosia sp.]
MDVAQFFASYGGFVFAMCAAGIFGGLIAGLLGVGGGIVIVPVLYLVLGALDVADDLRMKIAVATSLATIVVTSLSSARSHARRGAVDATLLRSWAVPVVIGVVIGTVLASFAQGWVLTLVFASMALLVALNMLLRGKGAQLRTEFPNQAVKFGFGVFVGLISAMMGIGGGTLSVPILTAFGFDIRRAVGTASAIGFLIAIPGTLGYVIAGWGVPGLPIASLGYFNLLAFVALVPLTALFAPVGARLAHTIPPKVLSYTFAAFLIATSAKMFLDLLPG